MFRAYGHPHETVTSFKYLELLFTVTADGWPAVIINLKKARNSWYCLYRIWGREGANPRMSGRFYLLVVQKVLLFGAETWVVTQRIGNLLGSFQHRVSKRMEGMQPQRWTDGIWIYPPLDNSLQVTGLETMENYIYRLKNTVTQKIVTRPILDLFREAERRPGLQVPRQWW